MFWENRLDTCEGVLGYSASTVSLNVIMSPSMNGIELMVFVDSPEKREEDAAYICLRSSREILVARTARQWRT
jgi:hypothetical protein